MLRVISERVASYFISSGVAKEKDKEVYIFGLENLINDITTILMLLFISIFFNNVIQTLAFLISFKVLRNYTGGYHANSRIRCFYTCIICYFSNILLIQCIKTKEEITILLYLCLVSVVFMLLLGPLQSKNKVITLQQKTYIKKMQRIVMCVTLCVILCFFYLNLTSLGIYCAMAFITVTLSLVIEVILRKGELWNQKNNEIKNR